MFRCLRKLKFLAMLLVIVITQSCVETASKGRISKLNDEVVDVNDDLPAPTFNNNLNSFHEGTQVANSVFTVNSNFVDTFQLRGKEIDNFIRNQEPNNAKCLAIYFPTSTGNDYLVLAAIPAQLRDIENGTVEFYYLFQPANSAYNKGFCQTAGVLNSLDNEHSGSTVVFSLAEVCTSCSSNTDLYSDPLSLYSTDGFQMVEVSVTYLRILFRITTEVDPPIGTVCTTDNNCTGLGFDCCSSGQCVNDGQIRSDADISGNAFTAALAEIANFPANFINFPEFFHICSISQPPTPTPTPTMTDEELEALRIIKLTELYECTTPIEGEMAICTITHTNVTPDPAVPTDFVTAPDDRNFNTNYTGTAGLLAHSIYEISHAGEILFQNGVDLLGGHVINATGNDNLADVQTITLSHVPDVSATNDDLKIKFKIDGSCEKVSSTLAKCTKYYIQGQNTGRIDDHFPSSNDFQLPVYADTSRSIDVTLDDVVRLKTIHWALVLTSPSVVQFNGPAIDVIDGQEVKLTFFVDLILNNVLQSYQDALDEIDTICNCGGPVCKLEPIIVSGALRDYKCLYPVIIEPVPDQQQVFLSSRRAPQRYFDTSGKYQSTIDINTTAQEGTLFEYTSSNHLLPNNVATDIGFSEIYGSLGTGINKALPALEVRVNKNETYDLFVDQPGTFSNCVACGNDYWSFVAKIFPQTFINTDGGGGYKPDFSTSDRVQSNLFRSDDLLFGRACFVPATMIPWTHRPTSDGQIQRLNRLSAQHHLFANGYKRDWYGFDYGSIIGSFDGVKWFSVGNNRRIKAKSNKLFLAINAYFSDLTLNNSYTISVGKVNPAFPSGSTILQDIDSSGAECQQLHVCDTDRDCITQLGWDYACQNVGDLKSNWPVFDDNGLEIPDTEINEKLISLFGITINGTTKKRCMYRGRGAACIRDPEVTDATTSYAGATDTRIHACSSNSYCQPFVDGVVVPSFNTKIARFARPVAEQNSSALVAESDLDTFGQGARILGRPYSYIGDQETNATLRTQLSSNNVTALCLPGRESDGATTTVRNSNFTIPSLTQTGDQVLNIGMTPSGSAQQLEYLSSCSVLEDSNYFKMKTVNLDSNLNNAALIIFAGTQSLPTNSLAILENLSGNDIIQDFSAVQVTTPNYQENRCLRAPGASCFTDQDCGPNDTLSQKLLGIVSDDHAGTLNQYEIEFWQQAMVCAQPTEKTEPTYDPKLNRCCRQDNKELTIGTKFDQTAFTGGAGLSADDTIPNIDNINIPGIAIDLDDSTRYSRISTTHDLVASAATTADFKALSAPMHDQCGATDTSVNGDCSDSTSADTLSQYNTFSKVAERTCCSENWVRDFSDTSGGGHRWSPDKMQNIEKSAFRCRNWEHCDDLGNNCPTATAFTCEHVTDPDNGNCLMRDETTPRAELFMRFMSSLELIGVPQIKIKTADFAEVQCKVNVDSQTTLDNNPVGSTVRISRTIDQAILENVGADIDTRGTPEWVDGATLNLYSAIDMDNFSTDTKQVFSKDKVVCCQPAGAEVDPNASPDICCTGFINQQTSQCALPDYANVSVYTNRFISSAAQDENISNFEPDTGYLKSTSLVTNLACNQNICASGVMALGIAYSNLRIPGFENATVGVGGSPVPVSRFRLIDGDDLANNPNGQADFFDAGLRWNNQVYCVPASLASSPPDFLTLTSCGP